MVAASTFAYDTITQERAMANIVRKSYVANDNQLNWVEQLRSVKDTSDWLSHQVMQHVVRT